MLRICEFVSVNVLPNTKAGTAQRPSGLIEFWLYSFFAFNASYMPAITICILSQWLRQLNNGPSSHYVVFSMKSLESESNKP
jgi:hypothetical protein